MQRVVTLGNGKQVSLGAYVRGWKEVLTVAPDTQYKHGLSGYFSASAAEILRDYRRGMHDRINRRAGGHVLAPETKRGRKDCSDWFYLMFRTSRDLNHPRLVIHWLPLELRERFAHRLADRDDY